MFLEVVLEVFGCAVPVELERLTLLALKVELEGGEALKFEASHLVSRGVHVGEDEPWDILELRGKFFPHWGHLLAVTAPWGVVLNEHVIVTVNDQLLVRRAHYHLQGLGVVLGCTVTLIVRGELARLEVTDESLNALHRQVLQVAIVDVLLHVLGGGIENS